ncbi:putative CDC50/LEM3 family protein [Helianthus annuus]|nr:putative CDC50/LEM3 family protein [Helianthus annuus]
MKSQIEWVQPSLSLHPVYESILLESLPSMVTQQELPACKPILTPKWVISALMLVTVVFIPIGVASLLASRDVVEIIDQYDNACLQGTKSQKVQSIQDPTTSKTCIRRLTVTKRMKQPIYVCYQLDNYYQNHRSYVKSRCDQQLRNRGDENETSTCKPEHEANGVYSTDNNLLWLLGSIQLITTCSWMQLLNFINCSQLNGVLQSRKSYNLVSYLAFSSS